MRVAHQSRRRERRRSIELKETLGYGTQLNRPAQRHFRLALARPQNKVYRKGPRFTHSNIRSMPTEELTRGLHPSRRAALPISATKKS